MVRKIFICFFVVLLLTSMVVPAFATSSGGVSVFSVFPIDFFVLNEGSHIGYVVEWPFNETSTNGRFIIADFVDSSSQSPFFSVEGYFLSNQITTSLFMPSDCLKFSFHLDEYYVKEGEFLLALPVDTTYFDSISVYGSYHVVAEDNDQYLLDSIEFDRSWNFSADEITSIDLGQYVRSASGFAGNTNTMFYTDVWIDIEVSPYYSPNGYEIFTYSDFVSVRPSAVNWFNYQQLSHDVIVTELPEDMFDWLLNAVDAFFNLQIVPGIKLNTIFYVVLVVTVLLAVIKIMH